MSLKGSAKLAIQPKRREEMGQPELDKVRVPRNWKYMRDWR